MTTQMTVRNDGQAQIIEKVIIHGDLEDLSPAERVSYYREVCNSLGLNPLTRPFEYIKLNDKLTLYARRDATDQIRRLNEVNVQIVARETTEGIYIVTARATGPDGRSDESIGAVPLVKADGEWKKSESGKSYFRPNGSTIPLAPDERANAIMKAETKAKRRVTLSLVGLGWLDETEVETIKDAKRVVVAETGDIIDSQPKPQPPTRPAASPQPAQGDRTIPDSFKDVGKMLEWAIKATGLSSKEILNVLGADNALLIATKHGSLRNAAEVLLANMPRSEEVKAALEQA